MAQCVVIFGVPVIVWVNSVAVFLHLRDLLALRLASCYFKECMTKAITIYQQRLKSDLEELASDVAYQSTLCSITETYGQALEPLQDLRPMDVAEVNSFCRPPQCVLDTAYVTMLLLESRADKNYWDQFRMKSYQLLQRLEKYYPLDPNLRLHLPAFEKFLETVDEEKAALCWRFAARFIVSMKQLVTIGRLRTDEFERKTARRDYVFKEKEAVHRFLQHLFFAESTN